MRVVHLPPSKSQVIRGEILRSFSPGIRLSSDVSTAVPCDDVSRTRKALEALDAGKPADCGESGAALRFLAVRVSRLPGRHVLTGRPGLLRRPHAEIRAVLSQLGVDVRIEPDHVRVEGEGWKRPEKPVSVGRGESSQFASALLLSSWGLPFDLETRWEGERLSDSYLRMSADMMRAVGGSVETSEGGVLVRRGTTIRKTGELRIEACASSAFSVAAAICARPSPFSEEPVLLRSCPPEDSNQPDARFPAILAKMGASVVRQEGGLLVRASPPLLPLSEDLRETPDLFPCLAALLVLSPGESKLTGAPHLKSKESDRIAGVAEMLRLTGREVEELPDGLRILRSYGKRPPAYRVECLGDHRLAMACGVLRSAGLPFEPDDPKVVRKSFPGFWDALRSLEGWQ